MARIQTVRTHVAARHGDEIISLSLMSSSVAGSGVFSTGHISLDEAEKLIKDLRTTLDSWPRAVTASDLGL